MRTAQHAWEKSCYFNIDYKIDEASTVYDAISRMSAYNVGCLIVTKNGVVSLLYMHIERTHGVINQRVADAFGLSFPCVDRVFLSLVCCGSAFCFASLHRDIFGVFHWDLRCEKNHRKQCVLKKSCETHRIKNL